MLLFIELYMQQNNYAIVKNRFTAICDYQNS
jgi:hypothetical protein